MLKTEPDLDTKFNVKRLISRNIQYLQRRPNPRQQLPAHELHPSLFLYERYLHYAGIKIIIS